MQSNAHLLNLLKHSTEPKTARIPHSLINCGLLQFPKWSLVCNNKISKYILSVLCFIKIIGNMCII